MCEDCDCEVQSVLSTNFPDDVESIPSTGTDSYCFDDFRNAPDVHEHWRPAAIWTAALAAARFVVKCRAHRAHAPETAIAASPEQTCIVFDWDDTLMPTSFLDDLERMMPKKGFGRQPSKQSGLSKDCPCYGAMERHASRVRSILRTARSCGHVAIVTMAERPWVFESAMEYLPGLDLEALLSELDIPVLYGPEFMGSTPVVVAQDDSVDVYVASKCAAMLDFLKPSVDSPCNLISIGDSTIEKDAAKHASLACGTPASPSLCKTVKLMTDPSLKELSCELETLQVWLEPLAKHLRPIDLNANRVEDLETQAQKLLSA
mmetsp:Transcript_50897/g.95212  ORF Transcript_50897/g.95212 Transcript_50897/m.95212 type:complete len:318 (-) Transcript_50897:511-1464(-)